MYLMQQLDLPHVHLTPVNQTPKPNQPLTRENLETVLKKGKQKVRFNVMTSTFEFVGVPATEAAQARVLAEITDTVQFLGMPRTRIDELLNVIAKDKGSYHPMEDWILSAPWDGEDRLAALAATVPTLSPMWPLYLRKWLIQMVAATRVWHQPLPSSFSQVLVFVGGQGAGKGRWLRSLAPGYVLADAELHLSGYNSKDDRIQALKWPIVELGEIDSTFKKSDVSALKGFLSRQVDEIRESYGRKAAAKFRMTTFAGSVNTTEFLVDGTGNRRFWPVQINAGGKLVWDHGIDVQQVFAQANTYYEAGEDWNLSDEDEATREDDVQDFIQVASVVDMALDHHARYRDNFECYALMNKTSIAKSIGASTHPAEMGALTQWLHTNLGPPRKLNGVQRCWAWPMPPGVDGVARAHTDSDMVKYIKAQPWYQEA